VRASQTVERVKEALEFVEGGQVRIMNDRQEWLFQRLPYPFDECFRHGRLRVKVVVERPAGNLNIGQDILERHALIAFGIEEALSRIEDLVALGGEFFFIDGTRHGWMPFHKQSLGLFL
jgi:hypothetical protein